MSNCIIAFDNKADLGTFAGGYGSYQSTLPLTNLLTTIVKKVSRTTDDANSSTKFRIALSEEVPLQLLGLMNTNASQTATYRWSIYSDSLYADLIYDSGTKTLYPEDTIPFGDPFFGGEEWWSGVPSEEELDKYQRNLFHVMTEFHYGRYIQFELFDTDNPDGYFQAGRLFLGKVFQPERNMEWGAGSQQDSRTEISRAVDGTKYFDARRPDLSFPIGFPVLNATEAAIVQDIQVTCDVHGEVLFIFNPASSAYWYRRSLFGQLARLDRITHPYFGNFSTAFQIEGLL